MKRYLIIGLSLILLVACASASPQQAVESHARAIYARDYASAYDFLSADDRAAFAKDAYVAQYESFTGAQLEVARHLAALIEFQNPQIIENGEVATVTVQVRAPNGNAPAIAEVLTAADQDGAEVAALRAKVDELLRSGELPFIEGEQTFELRRASGRWGVHLRLSEAALIRFTASVQAGLPWSFEPLQTSARLVPGDTVRVQYRVKNLSDHTLTGKADEGTFPDSLADHLYFYQCFCMFQLTLAPGEEQTLAAVVILRQPLPAGQNELEVRYDFYPIDAFPQSEGDGH
ncbi:MAG: cytochrome c oxidase assembly protein [Anaerolineales bacterium]